MGEHNAQLHNHRMPAHEVANEAARLAMTGFEYRASITLPWVMATAFYAADAGKVVRQLDDQTLWMWNGTSATNVESAWTQIATGAGGSGTAGAAGDPGEPGAEGIGISPDGDWGPYAVAGAEGLTTLRTLTPKVTGPAVVTLGVQIMGYERANFAVRGIADYRFAYYLAANGTVSFVGSGAPSAKNPDDFPAGWASAVILNQAATALLLQIQPGANAINAHVRVWQDEALPLSATAGGTPDPVDTVPTGSFLAPLGGAQFVIGQTYRILVAANDPDGAIDHIALLNGAVTLSDPMPRTASGAQYNWTPSGSPGPFSLTARVYDRLGSAGYYTAGPVVGTLVASATEHSAPVGSIASPASGFTAVLGGTTTFQVNATVADGTLVAITLLRGSATLETIVNPAQGITSIPHTWTAGDVGSVSITAQIRGSNGLVTTTAAVLGTVGEGAGHADPVATMTAPSAAHEWTVGVAATASATLSASGGATVSSARLYNGTTPLEALTLSGSPPSSGSCSHTPTAQEIGATSLTVRVTDSDGQTGTSAAVVGSIGAAPTATIALPVGGFSATEGNSFTVSGSYTLASGRTVGSLWILLNNANWVQATTDNGTLTMTRTLQAGDVGVASLVARITDSAGAIGNSAAVVGSISAAPSENIWSDNFDRADGDVGNGWAAANSATAVVSSNEMVRTDDGAYRILYNDGDGDWPADYVVTMYLPEASVSAGWFGLLGRYVPQAPWIGSGVQVFWQGSRTTMYVGQSDGDLSATLNNITPTVTGGYPASWSQNQQHSVSLSFVGSTVTIYLDGVEYGYFTTTRNNQVGTAVGCSGPGGNKHFLEFIVGTGLPT